MTKLKERERVKEKPAPEKVQADLPATIPHPVFVPNTEQARTLAMLEKLRDALTRMLASTGAPPDVMVRVNQVVTDTAAGVPTDDHHKAHEAAKAKA